MKIIRYYSICKTWLGSSTNYSISVKDFSNKEKALKELKELNLSKDKHCEYTLHHKQLVLY